MCLHPYTSYFYGEKVKTQNVEGLDWLVSWLRGLSHPAEKVLKGTDKQTDRGRTFSMLHNLSLSLSLVWEVLLIVGVQSLWTLQNTKEKETEGERRIRERGNFRGLCLCFVASSHCIIVPSPPSLFFLFYNNNNSLLLLSTTITCYYWLWSLLLFIPHCCFFHCTPSPPLFSGSRWPLLLPCLTPIFPFFPSFLLSLALHLYSSFVQGRSQCSRFPFYPLNDYRFELQQGQKPNQGQVSYLSAPSLTRNV